MGFLMNFMRNRGVVNAPSSFEGLPEEALDAHLGIHRYGDFELTDGIRPSYDLQVVPKQGYRHDVYRENQIRTPVIIAAVTRRKIFEAFIDLMDPLGKTVDVVLETSHENQTGHQDLYREHIDMPVLKSILWEFESLLANDGCTGIAVLNPAIPEEVQFDEHKLLIAYGDTLEKYEEILAAHHIRCDEQIRFLTEAEHMHSSSDEFSKQFAKLRTRLGMDEF